jgi:hypothetical protein
MPKFIGETLMPAGKRPWAKVRRQLQAASGAASGIRRGRNSHRAVVEVKVGEAEADAGHIRDPIRCVINVEVVGINCDLGERAVDRPGHRQCQREPLESLRARSFRLHTNWVGYD